MRNRKAEQREAREESIRRLAECVVRHEANGDHVQAAIFAELLVEATDRFAVADMVNEAHVVVGDHTPEPRHIQ